MNLWWHRFVIQCWGGLPGQQSDFKTRPCLKTGSRKRISHIVQHVNGPRVDLYWRWEVGSWYFWNPVLTWLILVSFPILHTMEIPSIISSNLNHEFSQALVLKLRKTFLTNECLSWAYVINTFTMKRTLALWKIEKWVWYVFTLEKEHKIIIIYYSWVSPNLIICRVCSRTPRIYFRAIAQRKTGSPGEEAPCLGSQRGKQQLQATPSPPAHQEILLHAAVWQVDHRLR